MTSYCVHSWRKLSLFNGYVRFYCTKCCCITKLKKIEDNEIFE